MSNTKSRRCSRWHAALGLSLCWAGVVLSSCTNLQTQVYDPPDNNSTEIENRLEPRIAQAEPSAANDSSATTPMVSAGERIRFLSATQADIGLQPESSKPPIEFRFSDAEVRSVVKSILGDNLGLSYQLHPRVSGRISVSSSGPVSAEQALFGLESALSIAGYALVWQQGVWKVLPRDEALTPAPLSSHHATYTSKPGFRLQFRALNYIEATKLQRLLESMGRSKAVLTANDDLNFVTLAGSANELDSLHALIDTLDVDWLSGLSIGIFPLNYATTGDVLPELQKIFESSEFGGYGALKLSSITRLNAILAITPNRDVLSKIEEWLVHLDLAGEGNGTQLYVYSARFRTAKNLMEALKPLLGSGIGGTIPPTAGTTRLGGNAPPGEGLFSGVGSQVIPVEMTNSLIIYANPNEFRSLKRLLDQIDQPVQQVMIEASLAEVTLNDDLRFGVQWTFEGLDGQVVLSPATSAVPAVVLPGFSAVYSGGASIAAALNALESITQVKVISSPKLLVLNHEEASLQIGDEVPIPTRSSVDVGAPGAPIVNNIQFRNTGVILTVRPHIGADDLVTLEIQQEVSDVAQTTSSGIDAPTIQQRELSSIISVRSGYTAALGGLIRETKSHSSSGVPWLQRLPLLGALFKSQSNSSRRTELVLLVSPTIIRNSNHLRDTATELRNRIIDAGNDPNWLLKN